MKIVLFDLDTGCAFTLLSEEVYEACVKTSPWIKTSLQEYNCRLKVYWFKEAIVNVDYKDKNFNLPCMVIKSGEKKLLSLLGHEAKLVFRDENGTPIFCKARPVRFAIKDAVQEELKRLVNSGCPNQQPVQWPKEFKSISKDSKTWICSSDVLALYDPTKKLKLTCDSSCYGIGAVLSYVINEEEKPISFASKTLSSAEQSNAQIEKEALVI
ncbi:hypothetical protein ILUMI_17630, partial [Ignelater luminosus]